MMLSLKGSGPQVLLAARKLAPCCRPDWPAVKHRRGAHIPNASRAQLALGASGLALVLGAHLYVPPALAEYTTLEAPQIQYAIQENPAIKPAMTVPEYVKRIEQARPAVYRLFSELADAGRFKDIVDDLNIDPFDTIAQSVYYLPWALLKVDPAGAQDCYDYAVEFQKGIKEFDRLCYLATRPTDVDEEQVLDGLRDLLDNRLEKVLSTVRVT